MRRGKKSPNQETGLRSRERLKVLNDAKLILNQHEGPLNHLKALEVPYSLNQYFDRDFFATFYRKTALDGELSNNLLFTSDS